MLNIQALTVRYGPTEALRGVSLRVDAGEVVALIGPNGAGKSTLIRAVSGVLPIAHGRVTLDGRDLPTLSPRERAQRIAVVPQARHLPPAFTVYQTVMLGRTPYLPWSGRPSAHDREQVRHALARTSLAGLANRRIETLSGGEQQRVLLARALAQEPQALLLDEPTTYLDLEHQTTFLKLVRALAHQQGWAVLMALHDLNQVGLYADRVALLVGGRLLTMGSPAEVLTADWLRRAFHTPVQVIPHPKTATPLVLPVVEEGTPWTT